MKTLKGIIAASLAAVCCLSAFSFGAAAEAVVFGDADSSGSVDIRDLVRVKRYFISHTTDINLTASDFNMSGDIEVSDMTALVKLLINGGQELSINVGTLDID